MKKLFLMVATVTASAILSGCGRMMFNTSNTTGTITDVTLTEGNFRVVKKVEGFASTTYVFGIGGLSKRAARENAVANMLKKADLTGSQTIANVYVKSHISTILGIYTRVSYSATGEVIEFYENMGNSNMRHNDAIYSDETAKPVNPQIIDKAGYEIGDTFNDGAKSGIVFEVYSDGRHGKIVNQEIVKNILWCTADNISLIGAKDRNNGKNNMNEIKSINGWQSKYPAFAKCAEFGDDWYIPSIKELYKLYSVRKSLNIPDIWRNATPIWSSTEAGKSSVESLLGSGASKKKNGYLVAIAEF